MGFFNFFVFRHFLFLTPYIAEVNPGVFGDNVQFIIPINETLDPEDVIENLSRLHSQIKWKNFKFIINESEYAKKGYLVVNFFYDEPERKFSIIIYSDKVQISCNNWRENLISSFIVSNLLTKGQSNILLNSLYYDLKVTRGKRSPFLDSLKGIVPNPLPDILVKLLTEGQENIFLESLFEDFKETGDFNKQFHEMCIEVLKSQYIDLVEGKVPKHLLGITKDTVRLTLENMLQAVNDLP